MPKTFKMLDTFQRARRAGAPFVAVLCSDARACINKLTEAAQALSKKAEAPVFEWTASTGIRGLNDSAKQATEGGGFFDATTKETYRVAYGMETAGFTFGMLAAENMPPRSLMFVHNAHRQIVSQEPGATAAAVQSVLNLRDGFKNDHRQLIFVGPSFSAPPELEHDIMILNEPFPTVEELETMLVEIANGVKYMKDGRVVTGIKPPVGDKLSRCVDALTGISIFAAEQVASMCVDENGFDEDAMWERKRATIEQNPALKIHRGGETFADIVGQDAVKEKLNQRRQAKRPIGVVVMIDEIDKALANVESDTTGTRLYQLLKLLTEMEDNRWPGLIAAGVAGGGKSLIAKAFGNECGVPTIKLDLGAAQSKWVGESEANTNRIIETIKSVGRGHAYFIATSNAATVMRPELQRRFFDGMWMFDLMSEPSKKACWKFYIKRYELDPKQSMPDDNGWTGAEIRNCCESAADCSITLLEAARFILPMAQTRGDEVERLRKTANGKFLDAEKVGPYVYDKKPMAKAMRTITLDE
jgi:ATPase family protein associated with various cellular activities (AAA)